MCALHAAVCENNASFPGAVFSVTEDRATGDVYAEVRTSPKIVRLAADGALLSLPSGVPEDPPADGVLQMGPDGQLYRLRGAVDSAAGLDVYPIQ